MTWKLRIIYNETVDREDNKAVGKVVIKKHLQLEQCLSTIESYKNKKIRKIIIESIK